MSSPRKRPRRSNTSRLRSSTGSIQPACRPYRSYTGCLPRTPRAVRSSGRSAPGPEMGRAPARAVPVAVGADDGTDLRLEVVVEREQGARAMMPVEALHPGGAGARRVDDPARPGEAAVAVAELERGLDHDDLRVPRLEADRAIERGIEGERGPLG